MKGFNHVSAAEVVGWTGDFVRTPSEQSDEMELDPAVQGFISDCAAPLVQRLGLRIARDDMGNLIAEAGPAEAEIQVGFVAYAMTHPRSHMQNPFDAQIATVDGVEIMRGRGVSEQKASMAASLAAVADLARSGGLSRRIAWLLLSAGETGRHDAIKAAITRLGSTPKYGIIAIGTGGDVSLGNRGRQDIAVTVHGKACHSSRPWLGVDATLGISELLQRAARLNETLGRHEKLGPASITCTAIHTGPKATHTVQSEGHMTFDRRILPDEDPDAVFAAVKAAFELPPPLRVSVERGPFMYGSLITEDSTLVRTARAAAAALGLRRPGSFHAFGAIDTGYLNRHGAEAMQWGVGDPSQFHTDNERVAIDELVAMAETYRATAALLLGQPAPAGVA